MMLLVRMTSVFAIEKIRDAWCVKKSKWNVVAFMRRHVGFGLGSRCRSGGGWTGARRGGTAIAAGFGATIAAAEKLKAFNNDTKFAALLAGLFVVPLVKLEPAFDQNGAALLHVLRERFSLTAKGVHVNKSHLFFFFAGFTGPVAINRHADFGDGQALGCVAQFRIARQIACQNDFVEIGHGALRG